jgi:hypothetical protein
MKFLIIATLLLTTKSFAQNFDLEAIKRLMTQRQSVLEKVYPGMSKKIIKISNIPTELGFCELKETSVQTVLKIDGEKIIIYSKEGYTPAPTPQCAGFESQSVEVVFFEERPSLTNEISDLNEMAPFLTSISRSGEIINLSLKVPVTTDNERTSTESVSVKYDLSKPFFKNTVLLEGPGSSMTGLDEADLDIYSLDLKKVLFCESPTYCSWGDWSDILF